jgi:hypothetical protein
VVLCFGKFDGMSTIVTPERLRDIGRKAVVQHQPLKLLWLPHAWRWGFYARAQCLYAELSE